MRQGVRGRVAVDLNPYEQDGVGVKSHATAVPADIIVDVAVAQGDISAASVHVDPSSPDGWGISVGDAQTLQPHLPTSDHDDSSFGLPIEDGPALCARLDRDIFADGQQVTTCSCRSRSRVGAVGKNQHIPGSGSEHSCS